MYKNIFVLVIQKYIHKNSYKGYIKRLHQCSSVQVFITLCPVRLKHTWLTSVDFEGKLMVILSGAFHLRNIEDMQDKGRPEDLD